MAKNKKEPIQGALIGAAAAIVVAIIGLVGSYLSAQRVSPSEEVAIGHVEPNGELSGFTISSLELDSAATTFVESFDGARVSPGARTFSSGARSFSFDEVSPPVFRITVENRFSQTIVITGISYHIEESIGELGSSGTEPDLLNPLAVYAHMIRPLPGYFGEDGWVFVDDLGNDLESRPVLFVPLEPQITVPPLSFASFSLELSSESEPTEIDYLMKIEVHTNLGSAITEGFVLVLHPYQNTASDRWVRGRVRPIQ